MRKIILLSFTLLSISFCSLATKHVVQVANFQFSPSTLNVSVGDTVRWVWVSGSHTTTDDPSTEGTENALPSGAASWNSPINSAVTFFEYKVTVPGTYNYYCIPHAPGMAASFTASTALPVKLSSFLVNADKTNKATLTWTTENEQNTDHFSVRRSNDGSNFSEIAVVPAAGNSTSSKTYTYSDSKMLGTEKFYYYNIAIVDRDGKQMFSDTKMFKNNKEITKIILSLSPNPISGAGHLMIKFNAEKEGRMDVRLISSDGKVVKATTMQAYPGVNNGHFHFGVLSTGTYTLVCNIDGVTESNKIVFK